MNAERIVAESGAARLDVFLSERLNITRSAAKKLIDDGHVTVGGAPVKASRAVNAGEEIFCEIPAPQALDLTPQDIPIDIVYEDDDIAVVNKPQGLTVHAGSGNLSGTLVNALLYHCRDLSGINGVLRPGIVHRIDKDTTGLIIVAKNDAAHLDLSQQLQRKSVSRLYYALVHGDFAHDHGTIDAPIGRDEKDRQKMAVTEKNSRDARTHFRVIERFRGFTLVECRLETGRTHQIRVHMRYIGHPVAGDEKYGYRKTLKTGGLIAVSIMIIGFAIFQFLPDLLLSFFAASEEMLSIGRPALRIISICFIPAAISISLTSAFQATGVGYAAMVVSIVRQLAVLLPVASLLAATGVLDNVWLSFTVAEAVGLTLSICFYAYVYKKKIKPIPA